MRYFIDFASGSLIKYGEELCGDNVEFYVDNDMSVAVLSDVLRRIFWLLLLLQLHLL